jgi:hypothetical protein
MKTMTQTMSESRPIFSSNLALRFYRQDGWTEALLRPCILSGDLVFFNDVFAWADRSYWIFAVHTKVDVYLLAEVAGPVFDFYNNMRSGEEALAYVKTMMW